LIALFYILLAAAMVNIFRRINERPSAYVIYDDGLSFRDVSQRTPNCPGLYAQEHNASQFTSNDASDNSW